MVEKTTWNNLITIFSSGNVEINIKFLFIID
jgi:hypothetical protein